jgi:hypothetical protein
MSPKPIGVMREGQATKLKYGLKGSPKQTSPTAVRVGPSLASQGALFGGDAGRNAQTSIRTKQSMGTTSNSSGTMNNYMRTSATNG